MSDTCLDVMIWDLFHPKLPHLASCKKMQPGTGCRLLLTVIFLLVYPESV